MLPFYHRFRKRFLFGYKFALSCIQCVLQAIIYVTFVREVVRPSHYVDVVVALLQMWTVCTVSCSFRAEIWISKEPTVILDSCICEQHAGQQRANATQVTICPIDTVAECWMWLLFFFPNMTTVFCFYTHVVCWVGEWVNPSRLIISPENSVRIWQLICFLLGPKHRYLTCWEWDSTIDYQR